MWEKSCGHKCPLDVRLVQGLVFYAKFLQSEGRCFGPIADFNLVVNVGYVALHGPLGSFMPYPILKIAQLALNVGMLVKHRDGGFPLLRSLHLLFYEHTR